MADVEMNGLGKRFGTVPVVQDVSLSIPNGEFLVLVGPSGCGKSTLLRMVAGLERSSEGEIRIGGRRANDLPPQKRNIAMVFQSYALYPHMTARENIAYGPKLRGENAGEVATKVEAAAGVLNLFDYLERFPRQLSGGQRQRVAMGRALVRKPDVFLFDEPLSNLDAKLRVQMRAEIKTLHRRLGTTSIYVTHDQIEAMTMADRIVVLNHGQVEQVGAPLELYDRPANLFVAGFLGSPAMSFLKGKLERNGPSVRVVLDETAAFDLTSDIDGENGQAVVLGVRPEQIELSEGGVPVTVETIEPTGAETYIYGKLAEQPVSIVVHRRAGVQPGDVIRVNAAPNELHLFDAASGKRL